MQTRYDLNGLFLLVLLGAATAAEAQASAVADRSVDERGRHNVTRST